MRTTSSGYGAGKRTARGAILLLLAIVFAGWLFMWIMMPTKAYKQKWQPPMRARLNSTYFGAQGSSLLVFTFPILFIAVLGSIYLHLGKDRPNPADSQETTKKDRLELWRRPILARGPLGTVSRMELAVLAMFTALLIWYFTTYIKTSFANIKAQPGDKVWLQKLGSAGLRLGLLGNLCCAFLFVPVTRMSSILPLVGLTSEASVKYHIWLGHIVMTVFTAHGLCFVILWAAAKELNELLKWDSVGVSNVAGESALIFGLVMWATSLPRVRRKMFEVFYYTHHLYFLFIFFYILHVGMSFFGLILPAIYLFFLDRYLRFLQSRTNVRLISTRLLPCDTLELNFTKSPSLRYSPGSIMFVNIPSISRLQWHPFTVSSNSNLEQDKLSVIIKTEGSWSQKLYQTLSDPSLDRLEVSVEGPYGPSSLHFPRHDKLVMVSGGSGITPFISIIREFIYKASTSSQTIAPQVLLICAFKKSSDLTMLDLLLPLSGTPSDISRLQLQVEAFVTREKSPTIDPHGLIRTVWFKPNPSDAPISAVLGPKSWLWLALIISTSFIFFLILLGITTRYYIYPIDHNTNQIYAYSKRSLLNIIFMCVSIVATASGAVLWNKKQGAMEGKQVQNIDGATPTTSPGSWFYNADRELESLPHQSLLQATNIHFGERPDLRKMLLECKGRSVGVMVSGPSSLRHQVAAICSSTLADNLHYESFSFAW